MKKHFILSFIVLFLVSVQACKNPDRLSKDEILAMADSSRNALDWDGTYYGILPCDDCDGIETAITIYYDNTFVKKTRHLGKEEGFSEISGTFTWNEIGNIITLDGKHSKLARGGYLVGEFQMFRLDRKGRRITGENAEQYRLIMVPDALFGKFWKLFEMNGQMLTFDESVQKPPFIILDGLESSFSGNAGCNNIMGQFETGEGVLQIRFSQVASTLMACPDMELETNFVKMIELVDNYKLNGDTLSVKSADGVTLARFVADYEAY